jgi:hypothetical protein
MDKLYGYSVSGYGIYSIEERQNRMMNVMLLFFERSFRVSVLVSPSCRFNLHPEKSLPDNNSWGG